MTDAQAAGTRSIAITTTLHPNSMIHGMMLSIQINGVAQPAQWGTGRWDVPRDEVVSIVVGAFRGGLQYGVVEYLLQPGAPTDLEYKTPAFLDRPGSMGPRGTVTHAGNNILVPVYVIGGIALLATVVIGGFVVLFAFL